MASSTTSSALVARTAAFVEKELAGNDASHDWRHIERVWTVAKRLAVDEHVPADAVEIVELAALLHDIDDWKYQADHEAPTKRAVAFLESQNVDADTTRRVMDIINSMGFKEELSGDRPSTVSVEFGCVQDADRLDAIGAIGIARCFTFGGHKKRPLYDPEIPPTQELTKEEYMQKGRNAPTINHFYEKLLKLRGMMKTDAGRRLAEERHAFMETFLTQFHKEIAGDA